MRIATIRSAASSLTEDDFAWATLKLMDMADKHADGRVVSVLEGGYDLAALASSVAVHVQALMRGTGDEARDRRRGR